MIDIDKLKQAIALTHECKYQEAEVIYDKLLEENIELMVVANVAEENIYNARRLIQREIKISFEKAGI